jgi:hypothetical protein
VAKAGLAMAFTHRRVALHGGLEGTRSEPAAGGTDAVRGGGTAGGHVGVGEAQGRVAHGRKSTSEQRRGGYHRPMSDRDPGEVPPRRLLERAPSDRYAASRPATTVAEREHDGTRRAVLLGLAAAAIGAAVHVAIAVLLLATGGLLAVAATLGFVVGASVRYGAGSRMVARARRATGVILAVVAIGAALAVNWGLSGAYLGPLDFLNQVYGLLVPLQIAAVAAGALAGTR